MPPDESVLLGQLVEDFTARVRAGQLPDREDYARQHPNLAERIRRLFPTLLLLEGMAGGKLAGSVSQATTGAGTLQAAIEVAEASPGTVIRGNRVSKGRDLMSPDHDDAQRRRGRRESTLTLAEPTRAARVSFPREMNSGGQKSRCSASPSGPPGVAPATACKIFCRGRRIRVTFCARKRLFYYQAKALKGP